MKTILILLLITVFIVSVFMASAILIDTALKGKKQQQETKNPKATSAKKR